MNCTNLTDQQLSVRAWLLAPHGDQSLLLPDSPAWRAAIQRLRQYLDHLALPEASKQEWLLRVLARASATGEIEPQAVMSQVWDSLQAEIACQAGTPDAREASLRWRLQIWLTQQEPAGATMPPSFTVLPPETPAPMPTQVLALTPLSRIRQWLAGLFARLRGLNLRWMEQP